MPKRTYEVLLVIEASSSAAGQRAANAAWEAANSSKGCSVADAVVSERLPSGTAADAGWSDWSEEKAITVRVEYRED